jgi:hypothetical protein
MPHLDEGLMMALLDGELTEPEQREVNGHLQSCSECSARLVELRGIMGDADNLVEVLVVPPVHTLPAASKRSPRLVSRRNLAWAASIVAALGLGAVGNSLLRRSDSDLAMTSSESPRELTQASPSLDSPAPPPAAEREALSPSVGGSAGTAPTAQQAQTTDLAPTRLEEAAPDSGRDRVLALQPGIVENSAEKLSIRGGRVDSPAQAAAGVGSRSQEEARREADFVLRAQPRAAAPSNALIPRDEVTGRQRLDGERAHPQRFSPIPMEEAVRHLGGIIRLIDGLTPEEFEVAATDSAQPLVRVTYRIGQAENRLFLEQRRVDNSFVASDLQTLAPAVELARNGNILSWNDLRGFSLTLVGPFSADSLFHFKTLVK